MENVVFCTVYVITSAFDELIKFLAMSVEKYMFEANNNENTRSKLTIKPTEWHLWLFLIFIADFDCIS